MSSLFQPRHMAIVPVRSRVVAEIKAQAAHEREREKREKSKVDQLNRVMDALELREKSLARQIARLQRRKAETCARIERVERATVRHIERCGVTRFDGFRSSLCVRPATPAVDITNEALIPDRFFKVETVAKPVKALIKAALQTGEEVPGVRLVQGMSLIRQ